MEFCHKYPGGTELEISMLFVDVRGSTKLAEGMRAAEFSGLMNSFYKQATSVLIKTNAFIDKLVGDEVIGLYFPLFAGKNHASMATQAARELLRAMQHGGEASQALPIGIGVHTGVAFVGTVSGIEGSVEDVTALGDNVNITARLAAHAGAGEALISEAAYAAAGLNIKNMEQRQLELKGKSEPVHVRVLKA
jgi:adenylate cyclase